MRRRTAWVLRCGVIDFLLFLRGWVTAVLSVTCLHGWSILDGWDELDRSVGSVDIPCAMPHTMI